MNDNRLTNHRARRGGFTLIEVLLVLVILVILGSLAVGMYSNTRKKAMMDAAKVKAGAVAKQVRLYENHVGELPPSLDALLTDPGVSGWAGPYVKEADLYDPWESPFQLQIIDDTNFTVSSMGPDRRSGNEDDVTSQ